MIAALRANGVPSYTSAMAPRRSGSIAALDTTCMPRLALPLDEARGRLAAGATQRQLQRQLQRRGPLPPEPGIPAVLLGPVSETSDARRDVITRGGRRVTSQSRHGITPNTRIESVEALVRASMRERHASGGDVNIAVVALNRAPATPSPAGRPGPDGRRGRSIAFADHVVTAGAGHPLRERARPRGLVHFDPSAPPCRGTDAAFIAALAGLCVRGTRARGWT